MKIMKKDQFLIGFVLKELQRGKIFVVPTDTSYGIAAKISPETIAKIFKIKRRPREKGIPIFANKKIARGIAIINKNTETLMKKFWPGALTLILKAQEDKITYLKPILGPKNTIAVREADNKLILEMLKEIKKPVTATSANISGEPPAYTSQEILNYFSKEPAPDYFIDAGALPKRPVSTIIDLTNNIKILRTGKIKKKDISAIIG